MSRTAELTVPWDVVTHNPEGREFPWPVAVTDSGRKITRGYERGDSGRYFVNGFREVFGSTSELFTSELVWCGFPAINVIRSATFGDRRHAWAVSTDEIEQADQYSYDPTGYAYQLGIDGMPAMVALNSLELVRGFGNYASRYEAKTSAKNLDYAVAALMIINNGDLRV